MDRCKRCDGQNVEILGLRKSLCRNCGATVKPWGWEFPIYSGAYLVKLLHISADCGTSMHFHNAKTETLICLFGAVEIEFDAGKKVVLYRGDTYTIPPGKEWAHAMRAVGDTYCEYFEASTNDPLDAVRLP